MPKANRSVHILKPLCSSASSVGLPHASTAFSTRCFACLYPCSESGLSVAQFRNVQHLSTRLGAPYHSSSSWPCCRGSRGCWIGVLADWDPHVLTSGANQSSKQTRRCSKFKPRSWPAGERGRDGTGRIAPAEPGTGGAQHRGCERLAPPAASCHPLGKCIRARTGCSVLPTGARAPASAWSDEHGA